MADKLQKNPHEFLSPEWYKWTHECLAMIHEGFLAWTKTIEFDSVLEVGCGKHDWYVERFVGKRYCGMDNSEDVFNHRCCSGHNYYPLHSSIWGSIEASDEYDIQTPFDLVFSHATIDHSPRPDEFIRQCIKAARKYVYIMSYRGYFSDIDEHKIEKGEDGYYYVDVSIKQVERLLKEMDCNFTILQVPNGLGPLEIQYETHIVIVK